MTTTQRVVLWFGLVNGVLMGLVPPWKHVSNYTLNGESDRSQRPAGYAFIAKPPAPAKNNLDPDLGTFGVGIAIDADRLALQYTVLALATGCLFMTVKARRDCRGCCDLSVGDAARDSNPAARDGARQAQMAADCSTVGPASTTTAVSGASWWRFRPLASLGFAVHGWSWFTAAVGVILLVFYFDSRTAHLSLTTPADVGELLGKVCGASIVCIGLAVTFSYITWLSGRKSAAAATLGWMMGVTVAVVCTASGIRMSERDRQRRVEQARQAAAWSASEAYRDVAQQYQTRRPLWEAGTVIRPAPAPPTPDAHRRSSDAAPAKAPRVIDVYEQDELDAQRQREQRPQPALRDAWDSVPE